MQKRGKCIIIYFTLLNINDDYNEQTVLSRIGGRAKLS